jgi:hypothetical protein
MATHLVQTIGRLVHALAPGRNMGGIHCKDRVRAILPLPYGRGSVLKDSYYRSLTVAAPS